VANINGQQICGETWGLELHESFGENGHRNDPKFQIRYLLCSAHHAQVDDNYHQASFISLQPHPSMLSEDVSTEIQEAGGYDEWVKKFNLDDSRESCLAQSGPRVEDYGDG
jgi:hypothetical protein